ncbi:retrovirus-related pol polyprotein from transposon TNT 1-94 [Tanacetum coccineum]
MAKLETSIVLITLETTKDWDLHQLEINNAFLHGYTDEEMYMLPPKGYYIGAPNQVCKHTRSLYGLKQALRQWNQKLTKLLISLTEIMSLKQALHKKFTIKDLGLGKYFLGIELCRTTTGLYAVQHLSQFVSSPKDVHMQAALHLLKYLKDIISKVGGIRRRGDGQKVVDGGNGVNGDFGYSKS